MSQNKKFAVSVRRATKPFVCAQCGNPIFFGEQYFERRHIAAARYVVLRWHMLCTQPTPTPKP